MGIWREQSTYEDMTEDMRGEWKRCYGVSTNPLGLAKRCLLGDGLIVPVEDAEEAEDADDESSSVDFRSGNGVRLSYSTVSSPAGSSSKVPCGKGGSKGRPASFAFAKER